MNNTLGKLLLTVAMITFLAPKLSARTEAFAGFKAWAVEKWQEVDSRAGQIKAKFKAPKLKAAFAKKYAEFKARRQNFKNDDIHRLAKQGHYKEVLRMLDTGVDANLRDTEGNTPLHYANDSRRIGTSSVVELLIGRGGEIDARNSDGATPLHFARVHKAELLLAKGADVMARDNAGSTPLHYAAVSGDQVRVGLLLLKGADAKATNSNGVTPLHAAVGLGDIFPVMVVVASIVLGFGTLAAVGVALCFTPATPVGAALVLTSGIGALTYSLFTPVIHEMEKKDLKAIVALLVEKGAQVNSRDNAGNTPLHTLAIGKIKPARIEFSRALAAQLINLGADVNVQNNAGMTPYDVAKKFKRVDVMATLSPKIIEAIDRRASAIKAKLPQKLKDAFAKKYAENKMREQNFKNDAIHRAAQAGNYKEMLALLLAGVDPSLRDSEGNTPLHYAITPSVSELLVNHGAQVDARNGDGATPLHFAGMQSEGKVKVLLAKGADVMVRDGAQATPLHYAAVSGNVGSVAALLAKHADPNAKNTLGITPLHAATAFGYFPYKMLTEGSLAIALGGVAVSVVALLIVLKLRTKEEVFPIGVVLGGQGLMMFTSSALHSSMLLLGPQGKSLKDAKGVVRQLLRGGARVNERDNVGNTPLHMLALGEIKLAKRLESGRVARLLIEKGADIEAKNDAGATPYEVAKEFNRIGLMTTLHPKAIELRGKVKEAAGGLRQKFAH